MLMEMVDVKTAMSRSEHQKSTFMYSAIVNQKMRKLGFRCTHDSRLLTHDLLPYFFIFFAIFFGKRPASRFLPDFILPLFDIWGFRLSVASQPLFATTRPSLIRHPREGGDPSKHPWTRLREIAPRSSNSLRQRPGWAPAFAGVTES